MKTEETLPRPRWTIGQLMIAVAVVAGCLAVGQAFGAFAGSVLVMFLGCGFLASLLPRHYPRVTFASVIVITTLFSISIAENEIYTLGADWFTWSHLFLFLASPTLLGLAVGWSLWQLGQPQTSQSILSQLLISLMIILPWSMIWTHWPLFTAFGLSESALNRLVDQVGAEEPIKYPVKAGVYWIAESSKVNVNGVDGIRFRIGNTGFRTGFVRNFTKQRVDTHLLGDGFNPHSPAGAWRFDPKG